jgi:iron complex transport system ATP-binding protein
MTADAPRLSVRGLAIEVPGRTLCRDVDFDVRAGEIWAIVGPNGAGKTTLVAALAGLTAPAAGSVAYDGQALRSLSPRARAMKRGYLPQDSVDFFAASVLDTVLVGRHPHIHRWQWESADDVDAARTALSAFGLDALAARDVRTLSGGERRRVALAALVAQDPALLLLDEPSSHLDLGQQVVALDVLAALARDRGKAIVMVLHELHLAARYAGHAIALGGGRALCGRSDDVLDDAALSSLFAHRLVSVGAGRSRAFLPD